MPEWRTVFDDIDVVSFDIYDTLVLRPFVRPVDLFLYIETKEKAEGFQKARMQAEKNARRTICDEINLDEIYSKINEKYRNLEEIEKTTEISLSIPNKTIVDAFNIAKQMGKKVILMTDMYLPRDVLVSVLNHCEIDGYDGLYISSESRCSKYSGKLYELVLSELSISPEKIIHIGDNKYSDGVMPKSKNIHTFHIESKLNEHLHNNPMMKKYISNHRLSESIIVASDSILSSNVKNKEEWYAIGYRYGGPLIASYVSHLIGEIPKDSKIIFVARDGYNLNRLFKKQFNYDIEYIQGQRILYYVISDKIIPFGKCHISTKIGNSVEGARTIKHIKYLLEFFKRELKIDNVPNENETIMVLYNENSEKIDELRINVKKYYLSLFTPSKKDIHVVDCTTMKFSSQKLIEYVLDKKVKGHYFVNLADDNNLDYEGFGHGKSAIFNWMWINIPEFFFSSPENTLIGWDTTGPILSNDNTEFEKKINYSSISNGIIDYYDDYIKTIPLSPEFTYDSVVKWSLLLSNNKNQYYNKMSEILWSDTPDHKELHHLIIGNKDIPYIVKKLICDLLTKINE